MNASNKRLIIALVVFGLFITATTTGLLITPRGQISFTIDDDPSFEPTTNDITSGETVSYYTAPTLITDSVMIIDESGDDTLWTISFSLENDNHLVAEPLVFFSFYTEYITDSVGIIYETANNDGDEYSLTTDVIKQIDYSGKVNIHLKLIYYSSSKLNVNAKEYLNIGSEYLSRGDSTAKPETEIPSLKLGTVIVKVENTAITTSMYLKNYASVSAVYMYFKDDGILVYKSPTEILQYKMDFLESNGYIFVTFDTESFNRTAHITALLRIDYYHKDEMKVTSVDDVISFNISSGSGETIAAIDPKTIIGVGVGIVGFAVIVGVIINRRRK